MTDQHDPELEELKRQVPAGWYPDAHDNTQEQYWDGDRWTDARRPLTQQVAGTSGGGVPGWAWLVGIFVLIVIVTAATGDDDSGSGGSPGGGGGAPSVDRSDPVRAQVDDALKSVSGPVEDPKIKHAVVGTNGATVTVQTPRGGFDGASTQDLDWEAGAVFTDIYRTTDWDGGTIVLFQGGLVDSATGKSLPKARTGAYSLAAGEAKQINWNNGNATDNIDWSIYRTYASPALKQDG